MARPLQRNAADPGQVRYAERKARQREERFQASLRTVLNSLEGRVVFWELLARAGVYRSVFDLSGSKTYYNAGRQDFGHELLALLTDADERAYLLMEQEAREFLRRRDAETAAMQAAQEDESNG
jgi:hypothetical protein